MNTQTTTKPAHTSDHEHSKIAHFFGEIFSFNSSLKLIHWNASGRGSYAAHISLDKTIITLLEVTDRLVETSYARFGDLNIIIPETKKPNDYISHMEDFFDYVEKKRALFTETFTQSILDDYQEGIQQLLFRLKRLQ